MTREKTYNFAAGPSVLPEEALKEAAAEMLNYRDSGMSVMEMSHRSSVYQEIFNETKNDLRNILAVPETHEILFLQGGASTQFSMIPLNLISAPGEADYALTGHFAKIAAKEAGKYGKINIAADTFPINNTSIPTQEELVLSENASYFYYCANNTIFGTEWKYTPDTGKVPLVADMSSNILTKAIDWDPHGIVYAGAQKNMAPAGVTVVIIRKDLAGHELPFTPLMMNYQTMIDKDS
ncbi:MAG: 3-phosphoserine/phosphohydroxythreonine transaminase, partial [Oscillospiraceae bacterium]|nr:3-phosphoserine/phosphohydroxythreonine transaminase [Oscillospiraceae bacterium]